MVDWERLQSELELFELMIPDYAGSIVRDAREIPDDKWNWSFSARTPSPREIVEHTFAWLWCDRQQLTVPERSRHRPTPDLPPERLPMTQLLLDEAMEWQNLIRSFSPEALIEEREWWDGHTINVRAFLFHMAQQVVYKAGQISLLTFELGLDGGNPYDAPWPNRIYGFADCPPWPAPRH